ncbi:hypothetical protein ACOBQJ_11120 [Pelotomaculum propionicicum]|uniref:hypothetical protein n=1 Tax=Pelotomaculum propionicicum TaxID=258475 RepID=UPI003B790C21
MPGNNKTISIRQRMIDRIFAEENLLQNLSHHYGADVETVKTWITDLYSDDMIRSIIVGLDKLEKAKEEMEKNGLISPQPSK